MSTKETLTPGQVACLAFGGGCAWVRLSPIQQGAWDRAASAAATIACAAEVSEREKTAVRCTALEAEIDEANATLALATAARDALETQLANATAYGESVTREVLALRRRVETAKIALSDTETTITTQGRA